MDTKGEKKYCGATGNKKSNITAQFGQFAQFGGRQSSPFKLKTR
jgi:hypothetical protein